MGFGNGGRVLSDAAAAAIIAPGTVFTNGTIVWSSELATRGYGEVSFWFLPTDLGSVSSVSLFLQWGEAPGIAWDAVSGLQQTDFLISQGTDGTFVPKDYSATLATGSGLVANTAKLLSFPVKGGACRFGVRGNHASGAFGVRALRIG